MKTTKQNTSEQAVALRKAAMAFGAHASTKAVGTFDAEGQRLNRELLAAAIEYARVAQR